MIHASTLINPFPGLRPFEAEETHLFFGREGQSDELLRKLRASRFVAVTGTSGSGKSSLVRAGLIPALQGGLMASAGSDWRIAVFRPGNDPVGNLARALADPAVIGREDDGDMQATFIETTLRRSTLGLRDVVVHANVPEGENILVVVDQFEEIFRFQQEVQTEQYHDDATAFVKLLLEATAPGDSSIFVVLTMRSDYLGECSQFRNLPEAINAGQYLIPRMTRDQRRSAIVGPVAVGGAEITAGLVQRLLNDVGDNPDQLPILQHALMRTWDFWSREDRGRGPIDFRHYEAIGGMAAALSLHADEAYEGLPDDHSRRLAEKLFKRLTEKGKDNREVRRQTELGELCALTQESEANVVAVIDVFRAEGRCFLMPPAYVELDAKSLVDISHESLIRNWKRLNDWASEEGQSARMYRRLVDAAALHAANEADLWRNPQLQNALDWREKALPNSAWAARYGGDYGQAMSFLDASKEAFKLEERKTLGKKRNRLFIGIAAIVVSVLLSLLIIDNYNARHRQQIAKKRLERIELNHKLTKAVLLNQYDEVNAIIRPLMQVSCQVKFTAKDHYLNYKNTEGKDLYHIEIFPIASSLPQGNKKIEFITYFADHPSFTTKLLLTTANNGFKAAYDGWGCLNSMSALIEYEDPEESPSVVEFDACELLKWK